MLTHLKMYLQLQYHGNKNELMNSCCCLCAWSKVVLWAAYNRWPDSV